MRIAPDRLGGIAAVVDQNLLRGDDDGAGVAIGGHVEGSVGRELHQVEAGEVAGRVVEEHVLAAGIGRVDARRVLRRVPAIDRGVVLHARIAAVPGGVGDQVQQLPRLEGLDGTAVFDRVRLEVAVAQDGIHEVVGDAHGVVGVLEEDGRIGFAVRAVAVVAFGDQRPGLGFFLLLAEDELFDVGMVDVEDDHLGGAARLAARLDDAGEGVEAFHEAERTARGAAAGESFFRRAQRRQVGAGTRSPLEQHAFSLGEGEDGVERILHRVDEAGRTLRRLVAGDTIFDTLRLVIPVPVLRVGVGLDAIAADIEPYRRVECRLLLQEQVGELVVEDGRIFGGLEVAAGNTPIANGLGNTGDERAHTALALGRAQRAVQIFAGDNVGRRHRPVLRHLDIFLLEDNAALSVGDLRGAQLPLELVIGRDAGRGEEALEAEAGCGEGA